MARSGRCRALARVLRGIATATTTVGFAMLVGACGPTGPEEPAGVQIPPQVLYADAIQLVDQFLLTEATARLETLIAEHPGTRLGTFSYLKLGDLFSTQEKWAEAEIAYRQFLTLNANSQFTPYVLYRLLVANYELGFTGFFFPSRAVDRDMEPNRRLVLEFKRFYLLYPNSIYLDEVRGYYRGARRLLSEYELLVGDFYFDREQYNAAVSRYQYLLLNYPDQSDASKAVEKLIAAYRANQQPELADELERSYEAGELSLTDEKANAVTVPPEPRAPPAPPEPPDEG